MELSKNMNNYFLRGSDCEKRDLVEGYHRFSDLLSNLKGEKKIFQEVGGQTYLWRQRQRRNSELNICET